MDPVSTAIIVALTASVTKEAGKEPDGGTYKALKAALQKKCGVDSSLVEAVEHLEKKPEAKARQAGVEEEVKAAKADQDPEILAAAQELLAKAQPGGVEWGDVTIVGDGNVVYAAPRPRIPLQRPPRAAHFTDRKDELARLLADLQPGRVVTLCGPDGIGKTALVAEVVWSLAPHQGEPPDRFPDGVIFHTFYGQPDPALALEHIVRSFGEEPKPTPAEAALRVLAGRQALLILDGTEEAKNLREVQRVTGGCGVLVTSHDRADAPDPTQCRDVRPLPLAEAVQLLQVLAPDQIEAEPTARRICEVVAGVPLAVQLVGRYLSANEEPAAEYLEWLETTPIAALSHGEHREESVGVLLQHSLAQVSEAACEVMGVAGLLALAPFGQEVVSAALEMDEGQVRKPLGELISLGLLQKETIHPSHKAFILHPYTVSHALIHTYARETIQPEAATVRRLAEYYTALAEVESAKGLEGYHRLDGERAHLMRVLAGCGEREEWEAVRSLVWAVEDYLDLCDYSTERVQALEFGVRAAQALGHHHNEEAFMGNLGNAYRDLGQVEKAIGYYEQSLTIAQKIGDRRRQGNHLGNLGNAYRDLGQVEKAIGYYEQALTIAQKSGDRRGQGNHLSNLGNAYSDLGQVEKAIGYYEQGLTIARKSGDRRGQGNHLSNLGNAYSDLGQVEKAIGYYEQGLTIAQKIGDRLNEAIHSHNTGELYKDQGNLLLARQHLRQAQAIFEEIKSPYAEESRKLLAELENNDTDH